MIHLILLLGDVELGKFELSSILLGLLQAGVGWFLCSSVPEYIAVLSAVSLGSVLPPSHTYQVHRLFLRWVSLLSTYPSQLPVMFVLTFGAVFLSVCLFLLVCWGKTHYPDQAGLELPEIWLPLPPGCQN